MLLIIFLGLIANLMSVSGECIGTQDVKVFDWNKFSGPKPWYCLLHNAIGTETNYDCPLITFESPVGNTSAIHASAYFLSEKRHDKFQGNATNWDSAGYFNMDFKDSRWTGRYYFVSIDYDRYAILTSCSFPPNQTPLYVLYRTSHPDKDTVELVQKKMKENAVDYKYLGEWQANHCQ